MGKIVWLFMALYLLNISVDNPDAKPSYIAENLSINDQESIVEIVVEQVLGYEDAIEEYDDTDCEDGAKKGFGKIDFVAKPELFPDTASTAVCESPQTFPLYAKRHPSPSTDIDNPPPNA